ncbi:MAG: serine/threonine-protein phosphatase [Clostridia bacterium]|nr:serine/threonine-protein phosphatase [Clostridia bacterium]
MEKHLIFSHLYYIIVGEYFDEDIILRISKITNTGGRPYNQDYADYAVCGNCICIAVADGLGAYVGSEVAGETAVKTVLTLFRSLHSKNTDLFNGAVMYKMFKSAHNAILKVKNSSTDLSASCTTLSVIIADEEKFIVAHEGDSRIYFFKNGTLSFYSKDHSLARLAVDRGEITADEVRFHKDQNKLTRVLGSDYYAQPDFKIYHGQTSDDSVLICTDGFWEKVYEKEMELTLKNTTGAVEALCAMESVLKDRLDEDSDNYTAVLLRFGDELTVSEETK